MRKIFTKSGVVLVLLFIVGCNGDGNKEKLSDESMTTLITVVDGQDELEPAPAESLVGIPLDERTKEDIELAILQTQLKREEAETQKAEAEEAVTRAKTAKRDAWLSWLRWVPVLRM